MLEFIEHKKDCTGCAACSNICPVNCISMKEDEEGFKYPYVDSERCIECNKCRDICPIYNNNTEKKPDIEQYAAAAVTKNYKIWKESSSGGAFTEICNVYDGQDSIIFGAAFNGVKVIHTYVKGVDNIGPLRKSKYVQSDIGLCYRKAEEFLNKGKKVVFSGTPCQIAGLKSYFGKNYENLLCIDFICHGVGSPKVFKEFLNYISNKYSSRIRKYEFRFKKVIMGNFHEYLSRYVFENNKVDFVNKDEYNQLFLSQLCLRKSCGSNCRFRTSNRMGDITIADFKNKNKIFSNLKDFKNYSTIVVNSKKGEEVFKKLEDKMNIFYCELDTIKKNNPLFYKTTYDNSLRDNFFKDFINGMEMKKIIKKYVSFPNRSLIDILKDLIPYRLRLWLSKKLRRHK